MKQLMAIVLLLNVFSFPQTSKEEILEQIKSRGDIIVTEEGNDIYRLDYPEETVQHFYLGKTESPRTDSIPTTVIETWNVDTNLYKDMYYFWQEVPVATSIGYELVIGDVNNNGYLEIYGHTKDYEEPLPSSVNIFEIDSLEVFVNKYIYPDSVIAARSLYDIAGDNKLRLLTRSRISGYKLFYKSDVINSLPTSIDIVFNLYPGQINDPKFGDFDKNGKTDFLFYDFSPRGTVICEYDSSMNNFLPIFEIRDTIGYYDGYAVGDFDLDGKTDIVFGSLEGEVFVVENQGEHSYSKVWMKDIDGYNSYMQIATNDIDKNDKPEFWVSSTTYNGFTDVTNFSCFEYTGDNEYAETYRIEFVGVFPVYAANAFSLDVNKDDTEELVICINDYIFIMQFRGNYTDPYYEIFYMTRDNIPGGYTGVTMYDLDRDGYEELLIHRDIVRSDGKSKDCTHIFKPDFVVQINNEIKYTITGYSLEQNYPNPFNPVTTISYSVPQSDMVSLKVYDLLGCEVATLVNEQKPAGDYSVKFNGSNLPSGIYFYKLTSGSFTNTKKLILLK